MKKFNNTAKKIFKPKRTNVLVTFVILILPLFTERVPTPEGAFTIVKYSPISLLVGYILLIGKQEFSPFFLIFSFCAVVYAVVSVITYVVTTRVLKNK